MQTYCCCMFICVYIYMRMCMYVTVSTACLSADAFCTRRCAGLRVCISVAACLQSCRRMLVHHVCVCRSMCMPLSVCLVMWVELRVETAMHASRLSRCDCNEVCEPRAAGSSAWVGQVIRGLDGNLANRVSARTGTSQNCQPPEDDGLERSLEHPEFGWGE